MATPSEPRTDASASEGFVVVVETGEGKFSQSIAAGTHVLRADEPRDVGGLDTGPSPYDLLLSSLGACTSMTIRMYASRAGLPLERVVVRLKHQKRHAEDCADCDAKEGKVDFIERSIELHGPNLDAVARNKLLQIADKCPVHRTLRSEIWIETRLEP